MALHGCAAVPGVEPAAAFWCQKFPSLCCEGFYRELAQFRITKSYTLSSAASPSCQLCSVVSLVHSRVSLRNKQYSSRSALRRLSL